MEWPPEEWDHGSGCECGICESSSESSETDSDIESDSTFKKTFSTHSDYDSDCDPPKNKVFKISRCQTFLPQFYPVYNCQKPNTDFRYGLWKNNFVNQFLCSDVISISPDSSFEFSLCIRPSTKTTKLPDTLRLKIINIFQEEEYFIIKPYPRSHYRMLEAPNSLVETIKIVSLLKSFNELGIEGESLIHQDYYFNTVKKLGKKLPRGYKILSNPYDISRLIIKGQEFIFSYKKYYESIRKMAERHLNLEICGLPTLKSLLPKDISDAYSLRPKAEQTLEKIKNKLGEYMDECHEALNMEDVKNFIISKVDSSWVSMPNLAQAQFGMIIFLCRALIMAAGEKELDKSRIFQLELLLDLHLDLLDLPLSIKYAIRKNAPMFLMWVDLGQNILYKSNLVYDASLSFEVEAKKQNEQ